MSAMFSGLRRRLLPLLPAAVAALGAAGLRGAESWQHWLTGDPADAHPAATRGGLLLLGGGGDVETAWRWFVACAGGGDIVVLRASGGDGYQQFLFEKIGGVNSVETILFKDASAARDPRVLEIIRQADGIFLAGGNQARYVRYWRDTPVADALNAHLRAGRPLGGTSAGLAVLGEFVFGALEDTVTSETALRDPHDRRVAVGRGFISVPPLAGIITDTHFMARKRLGRLVAFLARLAVDEKPARLAGLGVDEGTALCLEPDGTGRVHTVKQGCAWLVVPTEPPARVESGRPLLYRDLRVTGIGPDSTLHLADRTVGRPTAVRHVSAANGQLSETP
jgi:beta-aspartyl-peptidase (threonine type)